MARPGRPERNRAARSFGQLRRFHYGINSDKVFGTHKGGKDKLIHLNKGGFVTVLDKESGKVENVWQFAKNVTWVDSIDPKTGALNGRHEAVTTETRVLCPSPIGARSWNHAAYNPNTKLWYSNGWETCAKVKSGSQNPAEVGLAAMYFGAPEFEIVAPADGPSARLDARDPFTGKVKWSVEYKKVPGTSPVLTTGGGLVFNGDALGNFYAYDAETGKELWKLFTGSGIRSGPVSYEIDGEQYILVGSGLGGLAPNFASGAFPDMTGLPSGGVLMALKLGH